MSTMKPRTQIFARIGICVALAIPMYFVERGGGRQWLGVGGYIALVTLYLLIQAFTHFQHPLHGAVVVFLLALFYALAVPGWVHARVAGAPARVLIASPNPRPGVDSGWPLLFAFSRARPRATQAER